MGTSLTPNLSLIKPDGDELIQNFPAQHASNMDTLDGKLAEVFTDVIASTAHSTTKDISALGSFTGFGDGVVFVAPPSGAILAIFYDQLTITKSSTGSLVHRSAHCDLMLREGGTIGSGTVLNSVTQNNSITIGIGSTAEHRVTMGGMAMALIDILTPGATYNLEFVYRLNSTSNITAAESTSRRLRVLAVNF